MKKYTILFLIVLILGGFGCIGGSKEKIAATEPVKLEIWGVFDDENNYDNVIAAYRQLHPNVSIDFREFRFEEYEDELIRALAEGNGPDIFLVHNSWMKKYQSLMLPLPDTLTIGYQEVQGTVKKEVVNVLRTESTLSMRSLENNFVDAVAKDVVLNYQPDPKEPGEDRIYALPTHMDTLALFWNKDLLNTAGIAEAPKTWTEFQKAVTALTKITEDGTILQSGAAMGTSENVERSADLLAVLMMQNGTQMTNNKGRATFHQTPEGGSRGDLPGLDATRFYTDFANPTKEVYTWNAEQPNSFDAFTNGTTAMFFGYSYHVPLIKIAAPKLNFSVSELPQIDGGRQVNFASYWNMAVSKDTKNWNWAWDFIQFMTANSEQNAKYLAAAKKPPALRSLISSQIEDDDLAPFASQVLTAKSWYRGADVNAAEGALRELIDIILAGSADPTDAIELAASKVNQSL